MIRPPLPARAKRMAARFRHGESGVAAIEFALLAPLLVVFLLGTTSVTQSLWANGKISSASSTIGDLIAQETELTDASFLQLMNAGPVLIEPFPTGDMRTEVTAAIACHDNPNNIQNSTPKIFVVWSNAWAGGQLVDGPSSPDDPLPEPPTELTIEDGDYLIKTTVLYTYAPPITQRVDYTLPMREIAYHQPRGTAAVTYPQQQNATVKTCDDLLNR